MTVRDAAITRIAQALQTLEGEVPLEDMYYALEWVTEAARQSWIQKGKDIARLAEVAEDARRDAIVLSVLANEEKEL